MKLINYKIVMFHKVHILFHFNIILKHNGMSSTKIIFRELVSFSMCAVYVSTYLP